MNPFSGSGMGWAPKQHFLFYHLITKRFVAHLHFSLVAFILIRVILYTKHEDGSIFLQDTTNTFTPTLVTPPTSIILEDVRKPVNLEETLLHAQNLYRLRNEQDSLVLWTLHTLLNLLKPN